MWEVWENLVLPKDLKSCPKSYKSPNLVTLLLNSLGKRQFKIIYHRLLYKNGSFLASFSLFLSFKHLTVKMVIMKSCQ